MNSQQLTDLAHANLKEYRKQESITSPGFCFTSNDMLAFHKQGIREGIEMAIKLLVEMKGPATYLSSLQLQHSFGDILPEDPQPTSL